MAIIPDDVVERLRTLHDGLVGTSTKHEVVTALIHACLFDDINTGPAIIAALTQLGCDPQHVGITLRKGCGDDVKRHEWAKLPDGTYRSHRALGDDTS